MSVVKRMNQTNQSNQAPNSSLSSFGGSNLQGYTNSQSTFRVNPLAFPSLKNLDVDRLEEDLAKEIQRKKVLEERERRSVQKMFEESDEIKDLKCKIKLAQMNQERSKQILERQTRKLQDIVKDAETDETLLSNLEEERMRQQELEIRKKIDRLNSKHVLQQQMFVFCFALAQ